MQRVSFLALVAAIGCATQQTSAVPINGRPQAIGESGKADGDDDDDDDDDSFDTVVVDPPPGDLWFMPGEFESTDSMLVSIPASQTALHDWEVALVASSLPYIKVRVVTSSDFAEAIRATLFVEWGVSDDQLAEIDFITEADLGANGADTVWMRDFGPLVPVTYGDGRRIIDFGYHATLPDDDAMPRRLGDYWGVPTSTAPLDLEGGNFQSNSHGICIVSERAVAQNAKWCGDSDCEAYVKQVLFDYLSCTNTVIVPRLEGEGTGHIDMYIHVTGVWSVIVGEYTEEQSPANKLITDQAAEMLAEIGFTVTRIPMPTPAGEVFRSYTNALAVNGAVLIPVYTTDNVFEETALEVFHAAYPDRVLVPIVADAVIQYGGAVHCTTMSIGNVPE